MTFMNREARMPSLYNIRATGLGSILIHKDVLEKIRFRIASKKAFDDIWFCNDAKDKGFEIWADTSQQCIHFLNIDGKKQAVFLGKDGQAKLALYK